MNISNWVNLYKHISTVIKWGKFISKNKVFKMCKRSSWNTLLSKNIIEERKDYNVGTIIKLCT